MTGTTRIEVPVELLSHARFSTSAQFDLLMEKIQEAGGPEMAGKLCDYVREMLQGVFITGWVDWATRAPSYESRRKEP